MSTIPNDWFHTFSSTDQLIADGKSITNQFVSDIHQINPSQEFDVKVIINTTPALVFFDPSTKTVNLPLWDQLKKEAIVLLPLPIPPVIPTVFILIY